MAYRSVYDDDPALGMGEQTHNVVNNMYGYGDFQTQQLGLTPQSQRPISNVASQETYNIPQGQGKIGGLGPKATAGIGVMSAVGTALSANSDQFTQNYADIGIDRDATKMGKMAHKLEQQGGIMGLVGGAMGVQDAIKARNKKTKQQYRAATTKAEKRKYGWRAVKETVAGGFGFGSFTDNKAYREEEIAHNLKYPEKPLSAAITGAATGGQIGGYAMGGDLDMKEIEGPGGIDNVPIDADLNNAGETGRMIQGYAQGGKNAEVGIKLPGEKSHYIFSSETPGKTSFASLANATAKKYGYSKDADDFGGDQLAMQAFMSDISKLRDDQEKYKDSLILDEDGYPQMTDTGNYIIKDEGIMDKMAKKTRSTKKRVVKKLGDTTITQRDKEVQREMQGSATGGYINSSDIMDYGGYCRGGRVKGRATGGYAKGYQTGGEVNDQRVADSTRIANQTALDRATDEMMSLIEDAETPYTREQLVQSMKELVLQAETDPDLGLDDKYDVTFGYKSPGEFDIGDDKKRITDMTVSELRQFQKDFLPGFKERNPKFGDITDYAAGVYQITGETLDDFLANNPDYDIDTQLFDEQFQDDVFDWMMETGGIDKVISGDLTLEEFYSGGYDPKTGKSKRSGMLQRFASLPQLSGESEGETIYGGGVNKATIDTTVVREKFKDLSLYDDTIHHAGTLDEVNVTAQAPERAQHETSDIAMAGDTSILTRDDVPIQAREDTAFKGPFKKLRQKRWEKKLGLGDYAPTPEYYASQQEGEGFKGVATGGQVNPEMNPTGYATGGQIAGQAARILGMSAPAAYNIAYGLTEEPKKLEGNYMVAPIQDPEPIDITPELRAIEKAGAVTRSGGRARSSMAGQIASQTAEQEAVSQLYRDKRAIDTQADLRAEEVNAGIRSRNAQMEFAKDMQHIQAEEAMQQYINTGMGQIGQIAQTLGTEALAREQINIMGEHYASIAEQGDAMLKLRQQEIDQAGKLLEGMVDTGGTGTLPGDPAVPGGYAKQTGFGGQFLSEGYTEARGDEGRWTAGSTGGAEDGDPVTVAEGDIPVWGTAEGDWDTVSGKALDYIRSKREERGQVGAGKFSGYTDIQSFEDLTEDEQKEYFDYIDSQDDASRFYAIGDVPGVGYQTEAMDLGGKKTINSLMRTRQDHTGQTIPYLNEPDLQAEFNNDLYLANNGTWWQKMSDEHLSGYFSDSEDVVAPEYFNPMQYFDSPEEYASYMREWLGARGHYAVGRKNGKDVVYRYNKPGVSLGGMDLTPQGKLGGSFIEHKDPTLLDQVASAARFGLETGFTKSGSMPGMLKTGSFITKAAGGGFNIIKKGDKVAKGMKLIAGPQGELRLVKNNAFLQQGWKRVAKADEAITAAKIRAVGGKAYDATGAFKGAQPFLPTGFYVTGGGKVIAQATGKAVKGVVVKPISALANTKAVKTALGLGRQGMQKVWQGTKYVFSNGRWYKVTAQKAKETVKGTREAIKSGVKTIKKAATN